MTLKEQTLRCYFINNPDSPYFESPVFQGIMQFVQTSLNKAQLKQTGKLFLLVVRDMDGMEALLRLLTRMHAAVVEKPVAV
jgi:transcription-repair coupling factor (superfamily II helicase)